MIWFINPNNNACFRRRRDASLSQSASLCQGIVIELLLLSSRVLNLVFRGAKLGHALHSTHLYRVSNGRDIITNGTDRGAFRWCRGDAGKSIAGGGGLLDYCSTPPTLQAPRSQSSRFGHGDLPDFIGALLRSFKHLTTHVTVSDPPRGVVTRT